MQGQPATDVQNINGINVGHAFLKFYKLHPEIGLPTSQQEGEGDGKQLFNMPPSLGTALRLA